MVLDSLGGVSFVGAGFAMREGSRGFNPLSPKNAATRDRPNLVK